MPKSFFQFPEEEKRREELYYPEIKPKKTIITFPTTTPEAVEKTVKKPGLITVYWLYRYKESRGNVIVAGYVPETGERKLYVQWFVQDRWGEFHEDIEKMGSFTVEKAAEQLRYVRLNYLAPAHLMLPGPDRRAEYLASIDKPQEEPRPKRRGGYRGNYKKKEIHNGKT
jgi:hypothetical protein